MKDEIRKEELVKEILKDAERYWFTYIRSGYLR